MHIERSHNTTKKEAVQRIDIFLDELMKRQFPGKVVIEEPTKDWSGNIMNISFRVKRGILGTTITGTVLVDDQKIVLDINVPGIIMIFIPESKISEVINRQLDKIFPIST